MMMIAFGGVIGAGLFVGSGVVIKSAGPAAVVSFAITGLLIVLVMRMLGEMAVAQPAVGSFYEYARLAWSDRPTVSALAGFLTGWMYWYFWVIVVALEAVAAAGLVQFWLPNAPSWLISLTVLLALTVTNLVSVRSFGEFEFWFASIKVAAIVVFLGLAGMYVAGLWPGVASSIGNLTAHGGFAPNGLLPILTGAVAATGFYFGVEIVAVAAGEAAEPAKAVARATNSVITRVLFFYVGSILLVVCLVPWNSAQISTPYVSALHAMGIPGAAHIMNAVVLTAVLSALNSGLYASSRMLFALTRRGDAPHALAKLARNGVPARAILLGTLFGYATVVMSYVSPTTVFAFLVNSYGTVAVFVYMSIAISQLRLRARLEREDPARLGLRMWAYPYLTYLAIAGMLGILLAMSFIPDQRIPLLFGVISLGLLLLGFAARRRFGLALSIVGGAAALTLSAHVSAASITYRPITARMENRTVVLTGKDLTIEQVVEVARYGAKVALSAQARQRSADAHALLLEAANEGVSVYWFNRGSGSGREKFIFTGDPLSPENQKFLAERQLQIFRRGALAGMGPEVSDEEIVRAMLVVRANTMSYEAASPQLTQRLLDLLNERITPVVQSRGTVGEGDLGPFTNVAATMVGAGFAYYRGVRMPASQALKQAGLEPLAPTDADDSALESTNSYATGQVALLLYDAREALSWADLIYAIDLNGMNSSVSPLSTPVQANRPFKWLNWDASRVLDMLKGSYLFELDEKRIIQDPESLRASSIRQGSAWQAWAQLRDVAQVQMNSSDHNPAVRVGASPADSWELATPQLAQFYVKGGPRNHYQHGYVFSNANWDPYPMANEIEGFTIALANMDVVVAQRMLRFTNKFFTMIDNTAETPGEPGRFHLAEGSEIDAASLMQEIQGLINPVPPQGNALIQTVEDLQGQTRLKVQRARQVVDDTIELLAEDLLTGTYWLDIRKDQDASRQFGAAPTAVWTAFRATLPASGVSAATATQPIHEAAAAFIRANPASSFYRDNAREPDAPRLP